MNTWMPTRRALARLIVGWTAGLAASRGPGLAQALDQGIGGTGAAPDERPDRGIGGTGVIGTIRGFGSIVVNDQHIAYRPDVPVTIDGTPAGADDLRLGHVVRTLVRADAGRLEALRIGIVHEVVGPVQRANRTRMVVLGQTVLLPDTHRPHGWRRGDRVAVSGLRRPDGRIVASRIERTRSAEDRVVGIVTGRDATLSIGALRLAGLDAALLGARATVSGRLRGRRFEALSSRSELSAIQDLGADTYQIETFAMQSDRGVETGLGLTSPGLTLPDNQTVRVVLSARVSPAGGLEVSGVRPFGGGPAGGAQPGGSRPPLSGPPSPGRGPAPMGGAPPPGSPTTGGGGWGGTPPGGMAGPPGSRPNGFGGQSLGGPPPGGPPGGGPPGGGPAGSGGGGRGPGLNR